MADNTITPQGQQQAPLQTPQQASLQAPQQAPPQLSQDLLHETIKQTAQELQPEQQAQQETMKTSDAKPAPKQEEAKPEEKKAELERKAEREKNAEPEKKPEPEKKAEPIQKALRDGFGEGLVQAGNEDGNVVALSADLTESNRMEEFKKTFPERFVEVGIAEQNLVSVAAGMAHAGKVAFCASFAVFSPGRSWDQVRVSCAYSNANVKIYGGHAGITVGEDGATHQALEDIAITRVLPKMTVIVPADATEMRKATLAAAKTPGPFYLRGGRVKLPQVTKEEDHFVIGKANQLREGKDVTIIACGIMVREAMLAAEELRKQGIDAAVLNLHTIKPIDENAIIAAARETGAVVTAEEHQIRGGMGSAVCEVLSDHYPVPVEFVGVRDTFCESGTADALLDKYGLRAKDIVSATKRVLEQKKASNPAGSRVVAPKAAPVLEPATVKVVTVKKPKTPAKASAKAPAKAPAKKAAAKARTRAAA